MITYKQAYMRKRAALTRPGWMLDVQNALSEFLGGQNTMAGRIVAPSPETELQSRFGFHAPTGGQPGDYYDQMNQHIDRRLLAESARQEGEQTAYMQGEQAAAEQLAEMQRQREQQALAMMKQQWGSDPSTAGMTMPIDQEFLAQFNSQQNKRPVAQVQQPDANGMKLGTPADGSRVVGQFGINGTNYLKHSDGTITNGAIRRPRTQSNPPTNIAQNGTGGTMPRTEPTPQKRTSSGQLRPDYSTKPTSGNFYWDSMNGGWVPINATGNPVTNAEMGRPNTVKLNNNKVPQTHFKMQPNLAQPKSGRAMRNQMRRTV